MGVAVTDLHLALPVYIELKAPPGDPVVQGFADRLQPLFELSSAHDGLIAQSSDYTKRQLHLPLMERDMGPWAPLDEPSFYEGPRGVGNYSAKQMSVWRDLESLRDYTYRTDHVEAIQKRREWVRDIDAPSHVLWWIEAGTIPSQAEGCRRIEYLHEHGSSAWAFMANKPFDPDGESVSLR